MNLSDLTLRIQSAQQDGRFKVLPNSWQGPDFQSNDVLGLARNSALKTHLLQRMLNENIPLGAAASRSISGNLPIYHQCESALAQYAGTQAGILTSSAFQANALFFSTIPTRHDRIFYDKSVHASMRLAIHQSKIPSTGFPHADFNALESLLKKPHAGQTYLAIESVYSMTGYISNKTDLQSLHQSYGFRLVVDEAHSFGVLGHQGLGWALKKDREDWIFATIIGFGKALGSAGGGILGSQTLIELLSGTGKGFIYSTGIHPLAALQVSELMESPAWIAEGITQLHKNLNLIHGPKKPNSVPWILYMPMPKNREWEAKFGLKYLTPPTVDAGQEGYRCMVHAHNTEQELLTLNGCLRR